MRQFPTELPTAPATAQCAASYEIHVITPLFGGGVEAKKADPITAVRVPSVRGHLRFWWRATMGRGFGSTTDLHSRESEIWGSTSRASQVRIRIDNLQPGNDIGNENLDALKYVLFPFEPQEREKAIIGVRFTLCLDYPDALDADVKAAVTAWTNFGGLGSRTRRGCGALYCNETAPPSQAGLNQWWQGLQQMPPPFYGQRDWPVLSTAVMQRAAGGPAPNAARIVRQAWQAAIEPLTNFRQQIGFGRDAGRGGRPGRSRWPEADSLRAKTGRAAPGHEDPTTLPNPTVRPAFPRALLGLPIVFQFRPNPGDRPNEGTLYPKGEEAERMASPVILRPWKFADGAFAALCVPLIAPIPDGLVYVFRDEALAHWPITPSPAGMSPLYGADLTTYPNAPMAGRSANGVAIQAFLHYLASNGFTTLQ